MRLLISLIAICLTLSVASCDEVRRKKNAVVNRVRIKVNDKVDAFFPNFDHTTPNTRYNRKRFTEFFGFIPPHEIDSLYTYADEFGIDASYYIAFKCNAQTYQMIIDSLQLLPDTTNMTFGGGFNLPYAWWNTEHIEELKPYSKVEGNIYWYLWYDPELEKAYFMTYDI